MKKLQKCKKSGMIYLGVIMYKLVLMSIKDDDLIIEKKFADRSKAEALKEIVEKYCDANKIKVVIVGRDENA